MDPSGRFIHGSQAANKSSPRDSRDFMNWKLNFMTQAKCIEMRLVWVKIPLILNFKF